MAVRWGPGVPGGWQVPELGYRNIGSRFQQGAQEPAGRSTTSQGQMLLWGGNLKG